MAATTTNLRLVVASKNPVKIGATRDGFEKSFPGHTFSISGVDVPSDVAAQPMTSRETLGGALNRLHAARALVPDADYWIGIEGGVEQTNFGGDAADVMEVFAWIVIEAADGTRGMGRTGSFFLPEAVVKLVVGGLELGHADDQVFGGSNSKQKTGSVGLLTQDRITRQSYYEHAETITFPPYTPTSSAVPRYNIPSLEASFPQQSWPNESVAALAAVAGVAATLLVVWALQLRQKRAKVMTREGSDDSISPPDYVCAGSPIGTSVTLPASSSSYM
ncbi:hypothetical protein DYB35_010778 [Aphanomyces astaci]|uniref:inosine/xanthosine triphosphatase n=1 Tax=Aphanomyces astaci TaxID=112090 RepID=A0A418DYZ2_APHAT|nr:hypothetical protein DYB35_010778 [Aphanomyces astaci]